MRALLTLIILTLLIWYFYPQYQYIEWYKGSSMTGCHLISDPNYYQGHVRVKFDWQTLSFYPETVCEKGQTAYPVAPN